MLIKNDKIGRLLLSTDGSEFSEGAVREAVKLAKSYKGELSAIYVLETNPEYEAIAPGLVEKAEIEAKGILDKVKEKASSEGIKCETVVRREEQPFRAIVNEAEKREIDVIVMGRRGRTGLSRLLMGSVTAKVIGHAGCGILVVPRAARISFRSILLATDGSKYSAKAAEEAVAIAKTTGAALTAVSVVHSDTLQPIENVALKMKEKLEKETVEAATKMAEANVKAVRELASGSGVRVEGFIYTGMPYDSIVVAAKEKNADLIVIGSHGRTGLKRLLMGSVTERVVGLAECAVYVAKAT